MAINALLRHEAATVLSLAVLAGELEFGLSFVDGGRLHAPFSGLEAQAQNVLHRQLSLAMEQLQARLLVDNASEQRIVKKMVKG